MFSVSRCSVSVVTTNDNYQKRTRTPIQGTEFCIWKKQVRRDKKGKKIRKEKDGQRKLARQTPHLNMKLRQCLGLAARQGTWEILKPSLLSWLRNGLQIQERCPSLWGGWRIAAWRGKAKQEERVKFMKITLQAAITRSSIRLLSRKAAAMPRSVLILPCFLP